MFFKRGANGRQSFQSVFVYSNTLIGPRLSVTTSLSFFCSVGEGLNKGFSAEFSGNETQNASKTFFTTASWAIVRPREAAELSEEAHISSFVSFILQFFVRADLEVDGFLSIDFDYIGRRVSINSLDDSNVFVSNERRAWAACFRWKL